MKELIEKRNAKVAEMQGLLKLVKTEERAMSEEENTKFQDLEKEIAQLDVTIAAEARAKGLAILNNDEPKNEKEEKRAESEERAFANFLRGIVEERADVNLTTGDNGAVIPSTIANKIIKKVYEISPIYERATKYNVGGTFSIPYYDESTNQVTMAYADEFVELESTSGKYATVTLLGFLAGALTKVSKSLMNNSQFDIVSHVIENMAMAIKKWLEGELLNGTATKVAGLSGVTQSVTAAAATAITADELIKLQEAVLDDFQEDAIWIMNRKTRTAIRLLKDANERYLLNYDPSTKWGYTLFSKPVYTSDNMPEMAIAATAVYYGDMSGLAVKLSENLNIEVLREKYATQHAVGVVGWMEVDAKVENAQKIAKLVMASA